MSHRSGHDPEWAGNVTAARAARGNSSSDSQALLPSYDTAAAAARQELNLGEAEGAQLTEIIRCATAGTCIFVDGKRNSEAGLLVRSSASLYFLWMVC